MKQKGPCQSGLELHYKCPYGGLGGEKKSHATWLDVNILSRESCVSVGRRVAKLQCDSDDLWTFWTRTIRVHTCNTDIWEWGGQEGWGMAPTHRSGKEGLRACVCARMRASKARTDGDGRTDKEMMSRSDRSRCWVSSACFTLTHSETQEMDRNDERWGNDVAELRC